MALVPKSSSDSFSLGESQRGANDSHPVATDLFRATELDFLNYTATPPLRIKFAGHRTYASLATINNPTSPARRIRITDATTTLYGRIYDPEFTVLTLTGLTISFDVGTPGETVQGSSGDISVSVSGTLATVTIPGGLDQGVYSARFTVNTGTEESPVYRSYPTEAITIEVTEP